LLSPSLLHHALLAELEPSHAYRGGDLDEHRKSLREALKHALGWHHLPALSLPLAAERLWRRELDFGQVEKLRFASEPGSVVPAYLVLPAQGEPPFPVMICLQGHTSGMHVSVALDAADESRAIPVEGGRDIARQAAREGWAALCLEQRSLGERGERAQARVNLHNPCHDAALHALMLGRTLLGERIYDVDRALDLIASLPMLDASRVGIMGNSGGGTVALWSGALLDRLGFVLASCSLCTFRDSLMSVYHCADNYVPGVLRIAEMADVAGLVAPRPLLAVTGSEDPIFPLAGVRACFERLAEIYRAHGAEDRLALLVAEGGHRFYPELAWPVARRLSGWP
jgi:hypothetical protein